MFDILWFVCNFLLFIFWFESGVVLGGLVDDDLAVVFVVVVLGGLFVVAPSFVVDDIGGHGSSVGLVYLLVLGD